MHVGSACLHHAWSPAVRRIVFQLGGNQDWTDNIQNARHRVPLHSDKHVSFISVIDGRGTFVSEQ